MHLIAMEPVHEDTRTVIVRIKGQQSMPFILLLTGTVPGTAGCGGFTEKEILLCFQCIYVFTDDHVQLQIVKVSFQRLWA